MPIFDSEYPVNTSPAADDVILTTDTSAGKAVKGMTLTKLKDWLVSLTGWIVTAMIGDSQITTAKINNDAVTATKIDWAATGVDAGIWWEELGRTILGTAGDTITVNIPARKYLRIQYATNSTGGTNNVIIRFNGDSGNNYNMRYSDNNGASSVTGATNGVATDVGALAAIPFYGVVDIINISSLEKPLIVHAMSTQASGAANAVNVRESFAKWANTSSQITSVSVINSAGTGDFAIGSEVVVLGHN